MDAEQLVGETYVFDGYKIPLDIRKGLQDYLLYSREPDDFLYSVLSNNLLSTMGSIKPEHVAVLPDLVNWIYRFAPKGSYGCEAVVIRWIGKSKLRVVE
jgi:hypothetical protein